MMEQPPLAILRPVGHDAGAVDAPLVVTAGSDRIVVGRSEQADWRLSDPRVSRQHALITVIGRAVLLRDLGSRHGTIVNGNRLAAGGETALGRGDTVQFGGVRCIVHHRESLLSTHTIADDPAKVSIVSRESVGGLERTRLEALIDAAKRLAGAASRAEAASVLLRSVAALPECRRACVFQPIGPDDYELVASASAGETLTPSRSLLREASRGNLAQIMVDNTPDTRSHSIIQMQVQSAVCVPIRVANETDCLLYVDTREGERAIDSDAIAFCDAAAAITGLAIERILADTMADRQRQIELDLRSARDAQRMLFPAPRGTADGLEYVFQSTPGRYVGGDLFDLFPLSGGRTAFFLGDAAGKGAGAGVLMVSTQTLLRNLLEAGQSLAEALTRTNRGLVLRSEADKFVTLIAGVWDPAAGVLEMVDAGHGMVLLNRGDGFNAVRIAGDIPLGINASTEYVSGPISVGGAARIVVYSDGVAEQPDFAGEQFGAARIQACLRQATCPEEDVGGIVQAVRDHAKAAFSDDLTIASIAFSAG